MDYFKKSQCLIITFTIYNAMLLSSKITDFFLLLMNFH